MYSCLKMICFVAFLQLALIQDVFGQSGYLDYDYPYYQTGFQSEVTAVADDDPVDTFWAAVQFNAGYLGMQVNGPTERRIIFSIWDDPDKDSNATLIAIGPDTVYFEFGGEGTGINTHVEYMWPTGQPQNFLVTAQLTDSGTSSSYNAYYWLDNEWQFIARIKSPNNKDLILPYSSFLEDFGPDTTQIRKGLYGCQFTMDSSQSNQWNEIIEATTAFTAGDAGCKQTVQGSNFAMQIDGNSTSKTPSGTILFRNPCDHPPIPLPVELKPKNVKTIPMTTIRKCIPCDNRKSSAHVNTFLLEKS